MPINDLFIALGQKVNITAYSSIYAHKTLNEIISVSANATMYLFKMYAVCN